jgi:hypothetical protein
MFVHSLSLFMIWNAVIIAKLLLLRNYYHFYEQIIMILSPAWDCYYYDIVYCLIMDLPSS